MDLGTPLFLGDRPVIWRFLGPPQARFFLHFLDVSRGKRFQTKNYVEYLPQEFFIVNLILMLNSTVTLERKMVGEMNFGRKEVLKNLQKCGSPVLMKVQQTI